MEPVRMMNEFRNIVTVRIRELDKMKQKKESYLAFAENPGLQRRYKDETRDIDTIKCVNEEIYQELMRA